jgi:stage V sporulation protein R
LIHRHEGKELVREYVQSTMMGIEYLWGAPVVLDTSEIDDEALQKMSPQDMEKAMSAPEDVEFSFRKVRYTMKDRKLTKEIVKK